MLDMDHITGLHAEVLRHLAAKGSKQPAGARSRRTRRNKLGIFLPSLSREPIGQGHRKEAKMDIVLSVIGGNVFMPVACAIRDNLANLGQRTCRTISACPYRRLVWRKNGVDRLIDKGDFHLAPCRAVRGTSQTNCGCTPSAT
jgi:hypothetical protein